MSNENTTNTENEDLSTPETTSISKENLPEASTSSATKNHFDYINELKNDKFQSPHLLSYGEEDPDTSIKWGEIEGRKVNEKFIQNEREKYLIGDHSPDIVAMSKISLYDEHDQMEIEMDTSREFNESQKPILSKFNVNKILKGIENEIIGDYCRCNQEVKCSKPTIFFNDGQRTVDFILVWNIYNSQATAPDAYQRRKVFEENLVSEGLELEYEDPEKNGLWFVKVHAPVDVLRTYSEILKLRMPMKEDLCYLPQELRLRRFRNAANYIYQKVPGFQDMQQKSNFIFDTFTNGWEKVKAYILVDKEHFPEKGHRFTAIYSRDREYLFDVESPCFFRPAIKSRIVQFILDRKRFSDKTNEGFAFGIERLLDQNSYAAVYPLHDGDLKQPNSVRFLLYNEWAAISKWYRYQPLDYVREYFGVKIALYFAWLGFYTHMLLSAAIVGLICFIYALATLYTNKPSEDICNSTIQMCPLCDHWCDYWDLKETCVHARITYLFDNATTVFFAIFMSFWATLFLELWKRYSAEITHRWDLTGFDVQEEHPRPQYLARLSNVKECHVNIITNTMEPHVPFWRIRLPATILSFSIVLLLVVLFIYCYMLSAFGYYIATIFRTSSYYNEVCLAMAAVVGVVLYRISVMAALRVYGDKVTTSYAILFTTSTAACINLCCIFVFNWIYTFVAEYLTEIELLRTQTEFDDSLTLKIYLLQFVNYYASIFYIAFFKGKFIGTPKQYIKLFNYRQEECGPGGCLMELCIQLAIIMIGKQAMNTVLEMIFPLFYKWMNTLKVKTGLRKEDCSIRGALPQWVKDFKLVEWGPRSLFPEYLEMVLQYGFVTIFVAAFPLAPFFALLNNILEMRLDARKLLTFYRRPVSQRVRDIGVWYRILDSIGKLSVVTNGLIIAFTSDFIPRLVYRISVSENYSLEGYLNHSLSYFNTSDFQVGSAPRGNYNYTICRYPDYREPSWSNTRYEHSAMFWRVLAARLAFVVVFENVVAVVMIMVRWCIPDVPKQLRAKIRREAYITNEIIIKQETMRAQAGGKDMYAVRKSRAWIDGCPTNPTQWDRLINTSLSGSEFDLFDHSHNNTNQRNNAGKGDNITEPTTV